MEYKEALAKRQQLADKIKQMADAFEANGQEWKNGGDQSRFESLVAEHKSQQAIVNKHQSAMAVAQKAAVDGFGNGNRRGSVLFQAVDGSQIRGLKSGETFRPESATGFETEDEPTADYGDFLFFSMTGRQPASMQDVDIRNVATTPDSAGGFNVDSVLSSQVIEEVRSKSVALRAGATTIPMQSNELRIARFLTAPSAGWVAEGADIGVTDSTFDQVTLKPKKVAAIIVSTNEFWEDAQNGPAMLRSAVARALAEAVDHAILYGAGSGAEPQGILGATGVNAISVAAAPTDYSEIVEGVGTVLEAGYTGDVSSMSMVAHPRELKSYQGLVDSTGQPLQMPQWASDVRKFNTTATPSGGLHHVLLGDFSQVLVGMRYSGVRFEIFRSGEADTHSLISQDKTAIRAVMRMDVALARPSFLCTLDDVQE